MKRFLWICLLSVATLVACDRDLPSTDNGTEEPDPEPTPELPENYVSHNGVISELRSLRYGGNDTGNMGNQYAMAMTTHEGVESFDAIIALDEYLFISIGEDLLFEALESGDGHVDAMSISSDNEVYMFIAKLGALDIEDYAYDHFVVTKADVHFSMNDASRDITIRAHYETLLSDVVDVVATLKYEEPEVVYSDSFFRYSWGDVEVDALVGSAYAEELASGVVYTVCRDAVKTYVYCEDSLFIRVEVAGKSLDDDFEIDVTTYEGDFLVWACDPIKGMDLRITDENRKNRSGVVSVKDGCLRCNIRFDSPYGESDDIVMDVCYVDDYRSVNECVMISYDVCSELFTPRSVLLDNSGDSHYSIYVSSRADVASIKDMITPDVVLTYPKEGWEKWLLKGNFISGSSYPDMTFTYRKTTYVKGKNDCYGMNGQLIEYDAENCHLRLNLNLYTEEGGIALYYSGDFTLVE